MSERQKISVGILGATGAVGQRFVQLLEGHPWFEVTHLYASERSAGKHYAEATEWHLDSGLPEGVGSLIVSECVPSSDLPRIVFSALDSSVATDVEKSFARAGCVVVSNSSSYRMTDNVPLIIPEVNPEHLELIRSQDTFEQGGYIVTNPNCTTVGLTMVLKPLFDAFGLTRVSVVSMQAASGAGYPGVPSLDLIDNVIPYIAGEEDKIYTEPNKLLGRPERDHVEFVGIPIDATCNRVGVRDGHLEVVSVSFERPPADFTEIIEKLQSFQGLPQTSKLPSAPPSPLIYTGDPKRPQPVLDRMNGEGMAVTVGRVKPSRLFDVTLTLLVHNTIRGAAGAAILNAELLSEKGLL
jgi:aspartate-semialdehyde dehydrogenase